MPAKTLLDTAKALTSGDTVTLALSGSGKGEGLIGFEGAGRRTTTRLLEGDLPKYRTLFPTEFNSVAVIETAPSSRPSSAWPWWPSATPRSG